MSRTVGPEETLFEDFLDAAGKTRSFRLMLYAGGRFLEGREIRDNEPTGLRFVLAVPAGEPPPWGELRRRIQSRLAERHVVHDPSGVLTTLTNVIRGQLDEGEEEGIPALLVDDLRLTWDQLGQLLMPVVGFGIRIEIHDPGEE